MSHHNYCISSRDRVARLFKGGWWKRAIAQIIVLIAIYVIVLIVVQIEAVGKPMLFGVNIFVGNCSIDRICSIFGKGFACEPESFSFEEKGISSSGGDGAHGLRPAKKCIFPYLIAIREHIPIEVHVYFSSWRFAGVLDRNIYSVRFHLRNAYRRISFQPSSLILMEIVDGGFKGLCGLVFAGQSSLFHPVSLGLESNDRIRDSLINVGGTCRKTVGSILYPIGGCNHIAELLFGAIRIPFSQVELFDANPCQDTSKNYHQPIIQSGLCNATANKSQHSSRFREIIIHAGGAVSIVLGLGCFQFWLFFGLKTTQGKHILWSIGIGVFCMWMGFTLIHWAVNLDR